ncbi:protein of unknown function [Taphrina deformans PYCC 5710]|uniref:Uncharacterized protein n=1 Tax=Taphrina deformans (strain PYCC 5710 / ATCC 11124 / CBS 356.35 / IMI 108563 / JCM 9778 / NBRC 8474) TaxID=1097556 RepID=R4XHA6_TAPDE|nr:protein of unknown function [Taphrina deformans PYCC 5710]|eukprot:CCG83913.1 protein of unknown function [Taphrina deformans PYCC 5710]
MVVFYSPLCITHRFLKLVIKGLCKTVIRSRLSGHERFFGRLALKRSKKSALDIASSHATLKQHGFQSLFSFLKTSPQFCNLCIALC